MAATPDTLVSALAGLDETWHLGHIGVLTQKMEKQVKNPQLLLKTMTP